MYRVVSVFSVMYRVVSVFSVMYRVVWSLCSM